MKFPWEAGFPQRKPTQSLHFLHFPLLFLLKNFISKIAKGKRGRGRGTHSLPEVHQDLETHSLEVPHNINYEFSLGFLLLFFSLFEW